MLNIHDTPGVFTHPHLNLALDCVTCIQGINESSQITDQLNIYKHAKRPLMVLVIQQLLITSKLTSIQKRLTNRYLQCQRTKVQGSRSTLRFLILFYVCSRSRSSNSHKYFLRIQKSKSLTWSEQFRLNKPPSQSPFVKLQLMALSVEQCRRQ